MDDLHNAGKVGIWKHITKELEALGFYGIEEGSTLEEMDELDKYELEFSLCGEMDELDTPSWVTGNDILVAYTKFLAVYA